MVNELRQYISELFVNLYYVVGVCELDWIVIEE